MKAQTRKSINPVFVGFFTVSDDKCDSDHYIKLVNRKGGNGQAVHPRKDINRNLVHVVPFSQVWEAAHA